MVQGAISGDGLGGAPLLEPELYELDGIPLAHLPMPGPTVLTIAFGVGRAHESAVQSGVTHLVEHLLLTKLATDLDLSLDHSNGATEPFRVTFTTRGEPRDVSRFLAGLCKVIEYPPLARMHAEAVVLRTEAAGRGEAGIGLQSVFLRTGLQGVGLLRLPELFLHQLDEAVVRSWIAQHFTAGNAAIWIAGTLPDDLLVSLPPGERTAMPPYREIERFRTPTLVRTEFSGFGASFRSDRSMASDSAMRILGRWLRRTLRVDNALGYEVGNDRLPVGPNEAISSIWASCLPEKTRAVGQALLEAIDAMASRGPTDEDLRDLYRDLVEPMANPMAAPALLDAHLRDVLMGKRPSTTWELVNEQRALDNEEVRNAFRLLRDTMLLLVPPSAERPQRHFEPYPGPSIVPLEQARTFELNVKGGRNPFAKTPVPTLAISHTGAVVRDQRGRLLTGLAWPQTIAAVRRPDGSRLLLAADGRTVEIGPSLWKDGRDAVELVDRYAPPGSVVRITR